MNRTVKKWREKTLLFRLVVKLKDKTNMSTGSLKLLYVTFKAGVRGAWTFK
jgi:hypothetical protein